MKKNYYSSLFIFALFLLGMQGSVLAETAEYNSATRPPMLGKIEAENRALLEHIDSPETQTADLEQASTQLDLQREALDELRRTYARLEAKVESIGLTHALGLALRAHMRALPDSNSLKDRREKLRDKMNHVRAQMVELESGFPTEKEVNRAVRRMREDLGAAPLPESEAELRRLLAERDSKLHSAHKRCAAIFGKFVDLDSVMAELTSESLVQGKQLKRQVIWIASANPIWKGPVWERKRDLQWFVDSESWTKAAAGMARSVETNPGLVLLVVIVLSLSLFWRHGARQRAENPVEPPLFKTARGRFLQFCRDLARAILISMPGPSVLICIAWLFMTPAEVLPQVYSIAAGLVTVAGSLFWLGFFRQIATPGGICLHWLGWNPKRVELIRKHLKWFIPTVLATTFLYVISATQDDEGLKETYSQVTCLFFLFSTAFFIRKILTSIEGGSSPRNLPDRLRTAAMRLSLALPPVLVALGLAGYVFTVERMIDGFETALIALLAGTLSVVALDLAIDFWIEMCRKISPPIAQPASIAHVASSQAIAPIDPLDERYVLQTKTMATLGVGLLVAFIIWTIFQNLLPGLPTLLEMPLWNGPDIAAQVDKVKPQVVLFGDAVDASILLLTMILLLRHIAGPLHLFLFSIMPLDSSSRHAVITVSTYALVFPAVCLAASWVGLSWAKIQWLAAAFSVGLGFGLQEILANFVSGLILLFDRPVRLGDYVTVGGVSGYVTRIQVRSTTIMDSDWKELIIPNKEFLTRGVVNWSLSDPRVRVELPMGLSHDSDLSRALETLIEVARSHSKVETVPAPSALVTELGDRGIKLQLHFFVGHQSLRQTVTSDLIVLIKKAFAECGTSISFQR